MAADSSPLAPTPQLTIKSLLEREDNLSEEELTWLVERLAFVPERVAHSKLRKKAHVMLGGEKVIICVEVTPFKQHGNHPFIVAVKNEQYYIIRPITGELLPVDSKDDE